MCVDLTTYCHEDVSNVQCCRARYNQNWQMFVPLCPTTTLAACFPYTSLRHSLPHITAFQTTLTTAYMLYIVVVSVIFIYPRFYWSWLTVSDCRFGFELYSRTTNIFVTQLKFLRSLQVYVFHTTLTVICTVLPEWSTVAHSTISHYYMGSLSPTTASFLYKTSTSFSTLSADLLASSLVPSRELLWT